MAAEICGIVPRRPPSKIKKAPVAQRIEQLTPNEQAVGSIPIRGTWARGIAVTRIHGMDKSGVRFPAGPYFFWRCARVVESDSFENCYGVSHRRFESFHLRRPS